MALVAAALSQDLFAASEKVPSPEKSGLIVTKEEDDIRISLRIQQDHLSSQAQHPQDHRSEVGPFLNRSRGTLKQRTLAVAIAEVDVVQVAEPSHKVLVFKRPSSRAWVKRYQASLKNYSDKVSLGA